MVEERKQNITLLDFGKHPSLNFLVFLLKVSDSRAAIQSMFADFHRALHDRENRLLNQLDEFNQTRDSSVHKTMTRAYEVQMQEIVDFCSRTEEMINEKSLKV